MEPGLSDQDDVAAIREAWKQRLAAMEPGLSDQDDDDGVHNICLVE